MAIDDLLDEHEQGERVRTWLRDNGLGLVGGIALGLALIGGWQWWQKHQQQQRALAGGQYQAAVAAIESGDTKKAATQVEQLKGTAYGELAALALAKSQSDLGQRDAALATLRGAQAAGGPLTPVVEQRLARLLVDAGKPQEAIDLLGEANDAGGLEVRGDAQLAAGKRDAARDSYRQALTAAEEGSPQRRLLQIKLSGLGDAGTVEDAKPKAQS